MDEVLLEGLVVVALAALGLAGWGFTVAAVVAHSSSKGVEACDWLSFKALDVEDLLSSLTSCCPLGPGEPLDKVLGCRLLLELKKKT